MSTKLFDSHCHLHFSQFNDDREEIIKKLRDFNIKTINVGTDLEDSKRAIELAKKYSDIMWASIGLHPNDAPNVDFDYESFKELAKNDCVVAIGECGLDYYRVTNQESRIKQKDIFKKQIQLAAELKKPLILHCRASTGTQDAYEDSFDILNSYFLIRNSELNGVAHFFSGSKETAKKFLDLGFYIGFAGPITFAEEYCELVDFVPINRILIETDAPFAAPAPHRGKRNEPAYVEFVARKIAEWKNLSFKEIAEQTAVNAMKLFNIK